MKQKKLRVLVMLVEFHASQRLNKKSSLIPLAKANTSKKPIQTHSYYIFPIFSLSDFP